MTRQFKLKKPLLLLPLLSVLMTCQTVQAVENRFSISSDGLEVTDSKTGLIWQRCPVGMNWNSDNLSCDGQPDYRVWYDALHVPVNVANASGLPWRIPNVKELASILDRTVNNPSIDSVTFPCTPNHHFWTSTADTTDAFFAWMVDFYDGTVYPSFLEDWGALRLVRDPG